MAIAIPHEAARGVADPLVAEALAGLTRTPRSLSPKWLYDERGSLLFDEITRQPEYYPTRREREILERRAAEIARRAAPRTLVELGSGTSAKTRILLDALIAAGTLRRFVPFDVSAEVLGAAAAALARRYPRLAVEPVVGDLDRDLGLLAGGDGPRLFAFLGSTVGNYEPAPRAAFLRAVRAAMAPGDALLLGTDLVKDEARLVAAYDDAAGISAAFALNLLAVLNRALGAAFEPSRFRYVARWDARERWIEMALRSEVDQAVPVAALGGALAFRRGELLRTEVSAKFTRAQVADELGAAGLAHAAWWTDAAGDYGLSLAVAAR